MDEQQQIDEIKKQIGTWGREDWHDLRNHVGLIVAANANVARDVAVMQKEQQIQSKQLDRIEATIERVAEKRDDDSDRLLVLQTKADMAASSGAKWGAGVGAMVAAVIAGLWQAFGGTK